MTFNILTMVVVLNAIATVLLWRLAVRSPKKPNKKLLAALFNNKPIAPEYQPVQIVSKAFVSLITEDDKLFFRDFADFAAVLNCWLADKHVGGSWRVQELPDNELKLHTTDMPSFGRRFEIFHNQLCLGTFEISPGAPYNFEQKSVFANLQLKWIRLLPIESIYAFLDGIALHISDPSKDSIEYWHTRHAIDRALTHVLWFHQQIAKFDSESWGVLELHIDGGAAWYFVRKAAFQRKQCAG